HPELDRAKRESRNYGEQEVHSWTRERDTEEANTVFSEPVRIDRHRLRPSDEQIDSGEHVHDRKNHRPDRIEMRNRVQRQPTGVLGRPITPEIRDVSMRYFVEYDRHHERHELDREILD